MSDRGLGVGRGEGGVEEDVGRNGKHVGEVDAELGNQVKCEEGDGAVVAAGDQTGVELMLYIGGAGGWWGQGWGGNAIEDEAEGGGRGGGGLVEEGVETGQVLGVGDDDYTKLVRLLGQAAGNGKQRQDVSERAQGEEDDVVV